MQFLRSFDEVQDVLQQQVHERDEQWKTSRQKRMVLHNLHYTAVETLQILVKLCVQNLDYRENEGFLLRKILLLEITFFAWQREQVSKFCFCKENWVQLHCCPPRLFLLPLHGLIVREIYIRNICSNGSWSSPSFPWAMVFPGWLANCSLKGTGSGIFVHILILCHRGFHKILLSGLERRVVWLLMIFKSM